MEDVGDALEPLVVVACFEAEGCAVALVGTRPRRPGYIEDATKKVRLTTFVEQMD